MKNTHKTVDRHLYEISDDYKGLQKLLEEGDIEPEALADTMDAINIEFNLKAQQTAFIIGNISVPIDAINTRILKLQHRKKSIENKVLSMKSYLRNHMMRLDLKKITGDYCDITLCQGRESVVVKDVDDLPDDYVRVKTTIEADKKAIKTALESGITILGAELKRGDSSIKIN